MKYLLTKHKKDGDMIEATYTWINFQKEAKVMLAFVVHIDCIEDEDIKRQLSLDGMCDVEMTAA